MKTPAKLLVVAAVVGAVIAAVALKRTHQGSAPGAEASPSVATQPPTSNHTPAVPAASSAPAVAAKLPKLLDLGADKCIPCKMMAPILEELKREYAGRLQVEFIDVWKNPEAGRRYGIQMIPTQIFYDAEGRERFRHVGFISKEDILAKWKELGVDLGPK